MQQLSVAFRWQTPTSRLINLLFAFRLHRFSAPSSWGHLVVRRALLLIHSYACTRAVPQQGTFDRVDCDRRSVVAITPTSSHARAPSAFRVLIILRAALKNSPREDCSGDSLFIGYSCPLWNRRGWKLLLYRFTFDIHASCIYIEIRNSFFTSTLELLTRWLPRLGVHDQIFILKNSWNS